MNLFELSTVLSPIGGAIGGAVAVDRTASSTPAWMWLAIPLGLACGICCYRGLLRLAVGGHDKNPDIPAWRRMAFLGAAFVAPYVAALLAFLSVRVILYVLA